MQIPMPLPLAAIRRRLGLSVPETTDGVALLEADHRTVEKLFARFKMAKSSRDKGSIGRKICDELTIHTQIEEKIFYPQARKHLRDEVMVNEAVVEHAHLKELIRDLEAMKPSNEMYTADMKVLMDYVKHHVKEEESELFPKLRATPMDMEMAGTKMAAMKERLKGKAKANGHARSANGASTTRKTRSSKTTKRKAPARISGKSTRAMKH